MDRREFLGTVSLSLLAAPLAAGAQQPAGKVYKIGFMAGGAPETSKHMVEAFRLGLRDLGYVERRNLVIEYQGAEGKYDGHEQFAADLVRLQGVGRSPRVPVRLSFRGQNHALPAPLRLGSPE